MGVRRADDDDRINVPVGQQVLSGTIRLWYVEFLGDLFGKRAIDVRDGDDVRFGNPCRKIADVDFSEPPQPDHANLQPDAIQGMVVYLSLMQYLLEVDGVRKAFPGVLALDGVSMKVRAGSVHALMGENGAGKSTLMKIIAGLYQPDAGVIRLRGHACRLESPLDALEHGIAMIHQELNLMPSMTVAENIWIGREPLNRLGLVDHRALGRRTLELLAQLSIDMHPDERICDLTIAGRQMVEIARAVSHDSEILIMDEPTSTLTEREVDHLFKIIEDLKARERAIIYITHKITEVFRVADEVSVLRDGCMVGSDTVDRLDRDRLIAMMVGRELTQLFPKNNTPTTRVALSVRHLSRSGVFADVSFDVRAGEIFGIAGLVGSRRTEIVETLFGLTPATSGEILIDGVQVRVESPTTAIRHGMALLTEDRKTSGLFLPLSVQENMEVAVLTAGDPNAGPTRGSRAWDPNAAAAAWWNGRFMNRGFVKQKVLFAACGQMADTLRVKTPNLSEPIQNLSGGNQQKVLAGRWLLTSPRILMLDEPTRGIDVGAKAEIHRLISSLATAGTAVVMISSEMPEILGMSDRVMVMRQGRVAGVLDRSQANQVDLMKLAAH
jgi:inositol transport system ATP-binding protein